jgi:hypothetical protein
MLKHNNGTICTGMYHYDVINADLSKHHNENIYGELANTEIENIKTL